MITADKPALNEDLLVHFGIKGMRWGVRKYESKDERLRKVNKQLLKEGWRADQHASARARTARGATAAGLLLLGGHLVVNAMSNPRKLVGNRVAIGFLTGAAGYIAASEVMYARATDRVHKLSKERADLMKDGARA